MPLRGATTSDNAWRWDAYYLVLPCLESSVQCLARPSSGHRASPETKQKQRMRPEASRLPMPAAEPLASPSPAAAQAQTRAPGASPAGPRRDPSLNPDRQLASSSSSTPMMHHPGHSPAQAAGRLPLMPTMRFPRLAAVGLPQCWTPRHAPSPLLRSQWRAARETCRT